MNSQIEGFLLQLQAVDQGLPGIVARLTHDQFNWHASPDRWSIGQCVEHLSITTERYIPVISRAVVDARASRKLSEGPFALGFFERIFLATMEPPARWRVKTKKPFVAPPELALGAAVERFNRLQGQFAQCIRESEGLDLSAIKVRSQFGPLSWTLNGTYAFLLAHQRRHLWQAREVRTEKRFPAA